MARGPAIDENLYTDYLQHLLQGGLFHCRSLVQELFEKGIALGSIYDELLRKALYEIGEKWAAGEVSVAREHLASAVTEDVMRMAYLLTERIPRKEHKAVVACTANELHRIGARMVADLLELQGWEVLFLGADVPQDSLIELVNWCRPDLLGLSVTMPEHLPVLHETVAAMNRRFTNLKIIVGGQAFRLAGYNSEIVIPGAKYLETIGPTGLAWK